MSSQKDKYQKTTSFWDLILSKTDIALTTYPPKNFNLPPLQISMNAGGEPEIHNLKKKFLLNI